MQTIFVELDRQLSLEQLFTKEQLLEGGANWQHLLSLGELERLNLLKSEVGIDAVDKWQRGEINGAIWDAYQKMRSQEVTELDEAKQERAELQESLETVPPTVSEGELNKIREDAFKHVAENALTSNVLNAFQEQLGDELSADDLANLAALRIKLQTLRPPLDDFQGRLSNQNFLLMTLAGLALAVISFILNRSLGFLADSAVFASVVASVGALSAVILKAVDYYQAWQTHLQKWTNRVDDWYVKVESLKEAFETKMTESEQQMEAAKLADWQQKQEETKAEIARLDIEIAKREARLGVVGQFRSLTDLVKARLDKNNYEIGLGIMHQVQLDLSDFTNALVVSGDNDMFASEKQAFFPRGSARVVLYIDDLDRCPPKRVVEVLEAVQLLLKTQLFVVVLGLDTRYVTKALESQYPGVLVRNGKPSGLDYLEKIIQIPYRIRPISQTAMQQFPQGPHAD